MTFRQSKWWVLALLLMAGNIRADDGYRFRLKYDPIKNVANRQAYSRSA